MKFNMITKGVYAALLLSLALTSCNKDKETKQEERKVGEVPPTTNPAFMNLDAAPATDTPVANAAPAGTATVTPMQNPQAAAPVATAPGMNPPHGQPGHRCEIAVGAPLNSQPVAKPAPVAFTPPAAQQQQAEAQTVTPPGMNPPHGQPGHTCSVAVGAPLPQQQ
jgi:hypothetical protein